MSDTANLEISSVEATLANADGWTEDRERTTCSVCGKRRMCRMYFWGIPGFCQFLCSECEHD